MLLTKSSLLKLKSDSLVHKFMSPPKLHLISIHSYWVDNLAAYQEAALVEEAFLVVPQREVVENPQA